MPLLMDWSPPDPADLEGLGTSLGIAVAGRVPLDDVDTAAIVSDAGNVDEGWRQIYDGVATFSDNQVLRFAAPVEGGWQTLSFMDQKDGTWSTPLTPGPLEPWNDDED